MSMQYNGANAPSASDVTFTHHMAATLSTPEASAGSITALSALMRADLSALSPGERRTLSTLAQLISADGDVDMEEAQTMSTFISVMENLDIDSLGAVWPFPQWDMGKFPGPLLFGGILGMAVDFVVGAARDMMFSSAVDGLLADCGGGFCENLVGEAFDAVDLSTLSRAERADLLATLGVAAADGSLDTAETRALLQKLDAASGGGAQTQLQALDAFSNPWSYTQSDNGTATIDLGNGYEVLLNESRSSITLINENTGEKTVIWGDPHFDGNGDGVNDADFWGTLTLNLEDGTKITINTTPVNGNASVTLSSELTITKGDQAMIVTGLDSNEIGDLDIQQETRAGAGTITDFLTSDGLNIYENPNGEGWLVLDGAGFRQVSQADMDTTKGSESGSSFDLLPGLLALSSQMMIGTAMWLTAAMAAGQTDGSRGE